MNHLSLLLLLLILLIFDGFETCFEILYVSQVIHHFNQQILSLIFLICNPNLLFFFNFVHFSLIFFNFLLVLYQHAFYSISPVVFNRIHFMQFVKKNLQISLFGFQKLIFSHFGHILLLQLTDHLVVGLMHTVLFLLLLFDQDQFLLYVLLALQDAIQV